jgi:integrase/recombinase XerD
MKVKMTQSLTSQNTENLFSLMLSKDDAYADDARLFVDFLKSHNYGITLKGFRAYASYLDAERGGKKLSANSYNKRIVGAKNRLKMIFEKTPESFDVLKRYQFEEALGSIKLKKINSSSIGKEKILSEEEIDKLKTECEDPTIALMIEFLYVTGLRVSEMLGIFVSNVKKTNGFHEVTILGKGNKERKIKVKNELIYKVREQFKGKVYLFEHNRKQYNRISITNRVSIQSQIIIGKKISCHTLRHSFASNTLKRTNNLKGVSTYLGHSSVATTANLYIHDELTWEDLNQ